MPVERFNMLKMIEHVLGAQTLHDRARLQALQQPAPATAEEPRGTTNEGGRT